MEKEKNIIRQIANLITGNQKFEEDTQPETPAPASDINKLELKPDTPVASENGTYTVTVTDGVITNVEPVEEKKEEDAPADKPAEAIEQAANQFSAQFNEQINKLNSKIEHLEKSVNELGKQPAAAPVKRTESMSASAENIKANLRQYFTDEASYQEFIRKHS